MAEFKIKKSEIVAQISPTEGNPRNSEGDFIALKDGRIMFAYSRYKGKGSADHCPCDIACIYSSDGGRSFDLTPRILVSRAQYREYNERQPFKNAKRRFGTFLSYKA